MGSEQLIVATNTQVKNVWSFVGTEVPFEMFREKIVLKCGFANKWSGTKDTTC